MNAILLVNEDDNVIICIKPLTADEVLDLQHMSLTAASDALSYHRLALFAIRRGDLCYSFDRVIERAAQVIEQEEPAPSHARIDDYQDNHPVEKKRKRKPVP